MNKAQKLLFSLDEMANLRTTDTGLPVVLFAGPDPKVGHKGIRIKVSKSYSNKYDPNDTFVMYIDSNTVKITGNTGELSQKDITTIKDYFTLHIEDFKKYWNMEIDDTDLRGLLKK